MNNAQPGVFVEGTSHHRFLEYSSDEIAKAALSELFRIANNKALGSNIVVGFSKSLSNTLFKNDVPDDLADFKTMGDIQSPQSALSTQADIFVWIHGDKEDVVFDQARAVDTCLVNCAELQSEIRGFKYQENKDLIGFEDGTANPKTDDAKVDAALTSDGSAILLTQKWVHDLTSFNALTVTEQENIIGRTKVENTEFSGDDMPANSHIARTDVDIDGVGQKIYRRSMPFGNVSEMGLYFVAFSSQMQKLDIQLRRMYGLTDDGIHDDLTNYSVATRSSYWFIPSTAMLEHLQ